LLVYKSTVVSSFPQRVQLIMHLYMHNALVHVGYVEDVDVSASAPPAHPPATAPIQQVIGKVC
jgi:hypothetical protein